MQKYTTRCIVRLGEFHTVMSYLGCIGKRFKNSGLEVIKRIISYDLMITCYAALLHHIFVSNMIFKGCDFHFRIY